MSGRERASWAALVLGLVLIGCAVVVHVWAMRECGRVGGTVVFHGARLITCEGEAR